MKGLLILVLFLGVASAKSLYGEDLGQSMTAVEAEKRGWLKWVVPAIKIASVLLGKRDVAEGPADDALMKRELVALIEADKRSFEEIADDAIKRELMASIEAEKRGWLKWVGPVIQIASALLGKRDGADGPTDEALIKRELMAFTEADKRSFEEMADNIMKRKSIASTEAEKRGWLKWVVPAIKIASVLLGKRDGAEGPADDAHLKRELMTLIEADKRSFEGISDDAIKRELMTSVEAEKRGWLKWVVPAIKIASVLLGKRDGGADGPVDDALMKRELITLIGSDKRSLEYIAGGSTDDDLIKKELATLFQARHALNKEDLTQY